jgi:hypothetical protein
MATKKQRVRAEVVLAKKAAPLGAGRTARLTAIKQKYEISENVLRKWCLNSGGADYWN